MEEDNKAMKAQSEYFFTFLKDKEFAGITHNSLLKFIKTNDITLKDRNYPMDEELSKRLIRYLLKTIQVDLLPVKDEEFLVTNCQLETYTMSDRRFHSQMIKKLS